MSLLIIFLERHVNFSDDISISRKLLLYIIGNSISPNVNIYTDQCKREKKYGDIKWSFQITSDVKE